MPSEEAGGQVIPALNQVARPRAMILLASFSCTLLMPPNRDRSSGKRALKAKIVSPWQSMEAERGRLRGSGAREDSLSCYTWCCTGIQQCSARSKARRQANVLPANCLQAGASSLAFSTKSPGTCCFDVLQREQSRAHMQAHCVHNFHKGHLKLEFNYHLC